MKFAVSACVLVLMFVPQTLNIRSVPAGSLTPSVLTSSDLSFDGFIRVPSASPVPNFSFPSIAQSSGRNVAGAPHLLIWGSRGLGAYQKLYELNVDPAVIGALSPTIGSAPHAVLYADWGDPGHGNQQSWDASCVPQSSGFADINAQGLYYNDSTSLLYYAYNNSYVGAYIYNVMASSLDSISGTTGSTTFVGGPWRFEETSQYNSQVRHGFRSSYFQADPRDGTMLVGGAGYENPTKAWGPNLYGGRAWPTGADAGGCLSPAIVTPYEYIDYYPPFGYPSTAPGAYTAFTGTPIGTPGSFHFSSSFLSYPFNRSGGGGGGSIRSNPQVSNIASTSDFDATSFIGYYNGTNKQGYVFFMGTVASNDVDPTHCTTAALNDYLNSGVGQWMHFSSHTGSPADGVTLTGGTSGSTATVYGTQELASDNVMSTNQTVGPPFANFTPGETITGTGFTGVMDYWHRGDTFDNYTITSGTVVGCTCTQPPALCATGPSATFMTPILVFYSTTSLDNVKNNLATDYTTTPYDLVSLTASPFSLTLPNTIHPDGVGGHGGWLDAAHNKMYLVFWGQDDNGWGASTAPVIARFTIHDTPMPAPEPTLLSRLWDWAVSLLTTK